MLLYLNQILLQTWNIDLKLSLNKLESSIIYLRPLVGALKFVAWGTKPYTYYLTRYLLVPHEEIITQANKILKYTLTTKNPRILFRKQEVKYPVMRYSDADWSGDKADYIPMKSSLFLYADGPISWKSKKGRVCQSSTD
jgi:hypothetical protein